MISRSAAEKPSREQRRKAEILGAALQVFADKGFRDAGIADIASALGIGHGTFYRYFDNKHHVFDQVVQLVIERIGLALRDERPDASHDLPTYRTQVRRIAGKLLALLDEDPRAAKLLFVDAAGVSPELSAKLDSLWTALGQMTEAYLVNGKQRGFLRKDLDTEVAALAINALIFEGGRRIARAGLGAHARERWVSAVIALMFDGIRSREVED